MACRLGAAARAAVIQRRHPSIPSTTIAPPLQYPAVGVRGIRCKIKASSGGGGSESYLEMWKNSTDRQRREMEFQRIAENPAPVVSNGDESEKATEDLERKSSEFKKILEVPSEERDKIQKMQVIDRAAAAIAAARAILEENPPPTAATVSADQNASGFENSGSGSNSGMPSRNSYSSHSRTSGNETPGPDFWSWAPPLVDDLTLGDSSDLKNPPKPFVNANRLASLMEKDRSADYLAIPFETRAHETNLRLHLPPFQSMLEKGEAKEDLGVDFPAHAAEAAEALNNMDEESSYGISPDGSRWWKETGVEQKPDGVVCHWTLTRGVSADGVVEWENKYWEAANEFGYKELGSEKCGRDSRGNVWHEYWKESMWQERGLLHIEKTADKWGKNGKGEEWQEKWRENYDASGRADKWAHKWCSIDPNTKLEAGHAHVWHERWGEKYDGRGGSMKYTDKWAERREGDGWTKWGDKWDEHFDVNSHGVKQGETWWEGIHGERWNRTWGEQHNGSGWVHKYGKSSSGEHWDTHVEEDTWYEKYPHYGFLHCFENSVQLSEVRIKPSDTSS
ncbi:hypothetical protein Dimus_028839 [Dionaea muscipula]